jgi:membrane-associated phospholipid phosphatase
MRLLAGSGGYLATHGRRERRRALDTVSAAAPVLQAVDRIALGQLGSPHGSTTKVARAVSAVTRGGVGWHALSVALLAARRRDARQSATAGTVAWAATSLVVAGIKRVAERRRPRLAAVGPPTHSSSMPSSHTATAFAYSTAAAIQHPVAAVLLIPAGAVAWSRLQTRRHFPTDVIVGATVGLAAGAVTGVLVRRAAPSDPAACAEVRPRAGRGH